MARKASSTIVQEELYPPSAFHAREELDDARLLDLDVDEESPFLRGQKRVSARRSTLPKKTAHRLVWAAVAAAVLCAGVIVLAAAYHYGERSWRFRVASSDDIEVTGTQNVTKPQIMEVMGADIGRNIFFIPLAQQKAQLEQIPWVESASVMRFAPNRLKVEIHERMPVAFARVGPRIALIDAGGTLMDLSAKHKYSFPVILGMNPGEPLSTRAPRMKEYAELVRDLDSGGARYSQDLSEVDLSDLDDVKVRVNNPGGDVLVHLGSSEYLRRYKTFVTHAQEWRQQFQKLESVDLRYDNQIIVNPDMPRPPRQVALSPASAKVAVAAGVKPAALVTRMGTHDSLHDRAVPKPAFELPEKKLNPNAVANKPPRKHPKNTASSSAGVPPAVPRASSPSERRAKRTSKSRRDGGATVPGGSKTASRAASAKPKSSGVTGQK
ncbi:MAG: FtsQ-type POTRA domain-containing protein, partial [Candidatus Sulfotelmatobacter sp.]